MRRIYKILPALGFSTLMFTLIPTDWIVRTDSAPYKFAPNGDMLFYRDVLFPARLRWTEKFIATNETEFCKASGIGWYNHTEYAYGVARWAPTCLPPVGDYYTLHTTRQLCLFWPICTQPAITVQPDMYVPTNGAQFDG